MATRSGGRYVIRNGKPVLVERSGHQQTSNEPAPAAAEQPEQPVEEGHDEDTQETPAGGA